MTRSNQWRIVLGLLMITIVGNGAGCGGTPPPPPVSVPSVADSQGPPSAAAADVKNPTTPSAIEPTYVRPKVIDYGPSSAASADASKYKGR